MNGGIICMIEDNRVQMLDDYAKMAGITPHSPQEFIPPRL